MKSHVTSGFKREEYITYGAELTSDVQSYKKEDIDKEKKGQLLTVLEPTNMLVLCIKCCHIFKMNAIASSCYKAVAVDGLQRAVWRR